MTSFLLASISPSVCVDRRGTRQDARGFGFRYSVEEDTRFLIFELRMPTTIGRFLQFLNARNLVELVFLSFFFSSHL